MRICLLSNQFVPDSRLSGTTIHTQRLANELRKLNHDVEIVSLGAESGVRTYAAVASPTPSNVPIWNDTGALELVSPYSHKTVTSNIALWSKFLEAHKRHPFDIVQTTDYLAAGCLPAMCNAAPLVLRLTSNARRTGPNGKALTGFDEQFVDLGKRATILMADALITASDVSIEQVAQDTGVRTSEVTVLDEAPAHEADWEQIARAHLQVYERAHQSFEKNSGYAFYRKSPDQCLQDTAGMVVACDKMIYDLLYLQSWRFRIQHWRKQFSRHPRVAFAKSVLKLTRPICRLAGTRPNFITKLEAEIQQHAAAQIEPGLLHDSRC
jgi:hypothetical protein